MPSKKKTAQQLEKACRSLINIGVVPLLDHFEVLQHGKRVGLIYNDGFYLIIAPTMLPTLQTLLPHTQPCNPFNWPYYQLLPVPLDDPEPLCAAITAVWQAEYGAEEEVCDITSYFTFASHYPDWIERQYDAQRTLLQFAWDKGLLRHAPVDARGHILYLRLTRAELSDKGQTLFPSLQNKWDNYTSIISKTNDARRITNTAILEKYYRALCDAAEAGEG